MSQLPMSNPVPTPTMQPPGGPERRLSVRFPCALGASYRAGDAPGPAVHWEASACDVSVEGVGLVMDRPVETGTLLGLDLRSDDPSLAYTVHARVIHSRERPDGRWHVGCSFTRRLTPDEARDLG